MDRDTARPADKYTWEHGWVTLKPALIWKDMVVSHMSAAHEGKKLLPRLASVPAFPVLVLCHLWFKIVP